MWFESELFAKGMREGGKKTHTEKKTQGYFLKKSVKRALFACVCFPGRDRKVTREVTQTIQFILNSLSLRAI